MKALGAAGRPESSNPALLSAPLLPVFLLGLLLPPGVGAVSLRSTRAAEFRGRQQLAEQARQLPPVPSVPAASPYDISNCFDVPESICLRDGSGLSFVLGKPFYPPDLQLWFDFDKALPVDESGHSKHLTDTNLALTPLPAGPGLLGRGASAAFDGRLYRTVAQTDMLNTPAWTVALWLYLREDSVGSWRTIFSRGSRPEELSPALLLAPDERRLHVHVSPHAEAAGGVLDASGLLPLRRWTHVAVVCTGSVVRLFINGVKDGEVILEETVPDSSGPLHIGRDPWRAGTKAFLDDFRWYTRELPPDELRALVYPSLTGMAATDAISLGCVACGFAEAVQACDAKREHLCSLQELFSGGFHAARAMGWLSASSEVWYHEEDDGRFDGSTRLGICCTG